MFVVDTIHEKGAGKLQRAESQVKSTANFLHQQTSTKKNITQLSGQEDANGQINWRNTLATSLSVTHDFRSIRNEEAVF